jgi:5-amino-6-(5-phosphoribosylamino)uracil reductase
MKVFSNLAVTLDGKIADARHPSQSLGTKADKALMKKIREMADVVVMGADTLRALGDAVVIKNKKRRNLVNAVVTGTGVIDPKLKFWDRKDVLRFVFTSKANFHKAVESAQDRAFVVAIGDEYLSAKELLKTLEKAGFQNILVEGGGKLMGLFLKEALLDEVFLTLTPHLMGGSANPSLVSTVDTLSPRPKLKLLKQKKVANEVFLHYRILNTAKS